MVSICSFRPQDILYFFRLIFPDLLFLDHIAAWLAVGSIQSWIQFYMILYALTEKDESIWSLVSFIRWIFYFLRDGKSLSYEKFILQAKSIKIGFWVVFILSVSRSCLFLHTWWWPNDGNGKPEIILFVVIGRNNGTQFFGWN